MSLVSLVSPCIPCIPFYPPVSSCILLYPPVSHCIPCIPTYPLYPLYPFVTYCILLYPTVSPVSLRIHFIHCIPPVTYCIPPGRVLYVSFITCYNSITNVHYNTYKLLIKIQSSTTQSYAPPHLNTLYPPPSFQIYTCNFTQLYSSPCFL